MRVPAARFGGFDIGGVVVGEEQVGPRPPAARFDDFVDARIRLGDFLDTRHDDVFEMIENRLGRAEQLPEFVAEIGQAEQGHARRCQPFDNGVGTINRPRHGFVEARGIGIDVLSISRKQRDSFRHHIRQSAAAIMFEMPFLGHDIGKEPFQLLLALDQLFEQRRKLPLEQHPPDIEHHCLLHVACPPKACGPRSGKEAGR